MKMPKQRFIFLLRDDFLSFFGVRGEIVEFVRVVFPVTSKLPVEEEFPLTFPDFAVDFRIIQTESHGGRIFFEFFMIVVKEGTWGKLATLKSGQNVEAVFGTFFSVCWIGKAFSEDGAKCSIEILQGDEFGADLAGSSWVAVTNTSGRPGDDEGNSVTTFVGRTFVAANRSCGGFGSDLGTVVGGEDDDRIVDKLVARATGIFGRLQVRDESPKCHVVFVDVVVADSHGFARFGLGSSSNGNACDGFVRCVGAVVGVGRIVEKERVILGVFSSEMMVEKLGSMIRMTGTELGQDVSIGAIFLELFAIASRTDSFVTMKVSGAHILSRGIGFGTFGPGWIWPGSSMGTGSVTGKVETMVGGAVC